VLCDGSRGHALKNRLHIDLDPDDMEAEVVRVLALGARPADVGQGDVPWVVLADLRRSARLLGTKQALAPLFCGN
jgi:nucleotidyltransferase/DNA polymerase involved in DNA repair